MKYIVFTLVALFLIKSLSAQKSVPSVDVQTLEGERVNLSDYAGKGDFTILSFWATWCKPCKTELDAIYDIYPDWQEEFGVELVAVSIDDSRTMRKVIPMVEQKDWPYTILTDSNQNLVNPEGQIIYSHNGYTPGSEYELEDKMREAQMK
jgi:peroxiredoxin